MRCRSKGLTLVEVVASLALLATTLILILQAFGQHSRQLVDADRQIRAHQELERLLANWFASAEPLPVGQSGWTGDDREFVWTCRPHSSPSHLGSLGATIVRVELFADRRWNRPVASVELLSSELPVSRTDGGDQSEGME